MIAVRLMMELLNLMLREWTLSSVDTWPSSLFRLPLNGSHVVAVALLEQLPCVVAIGSFVPEAVRIDDLMVFQEGAPERERLEVFDPRFGS